MSTDSFKVDATLIGAEAPEDILKSVLAALNQGNISRAVEQFADHFTFNDYALDLKFTEKERLSEFFQKSRELFPDAAVEVVSAFESGDLAVAEWKVTATQMIPGPTRYQFPVLLRGSTIVQIENRRVTRWSDYYDQAKSRRVSLGAFFEEWIDY